MTIRQTLEVFLLFGMGSQYDHKIRMRLSRQGVYCLSADPASVTAADVAKLRPTGIILSGGPVSVGADPPPFDEAIFDLGIPVLGICLGFQMWAKHRGLEVVAADRAEFGVHQLNIRPRQSLLFSGVPAASSVVQSHRDHIVWGHGLTILGSTDNTEVAAGNMDHLWGVQFHPEVSHTDCGDKILANFCFNICGAQDRFPAEDVAQTKINDLRGQIGDQKVAIALSGGKDSSTCAHLIGRAVNYQQGRVVGIYIKGIDRADDEAHVLEFFGNLPWLELKVVDATEAFLEALRGLESMADKRTAMKGVYRNILVYEALLFGAAFMVQGTLYTDIVESGGGMESGAVKAVIKKHHNVGLDWGDELTELTPLDDQVKDTGIEIGEAVGVPTAILDSQPFPGPGLVVRIEGDITAEKLGIAREADRIFVEELRKWDLYEEVWQAGVVVLDTLTTVSKGDAAGEHLVVMLFAVTSVDGFTAEFARLPWDFLDHVSRRLTNEIPAIGRASYSISGKPPATIEIG